MKETCRFFGATEKGDYDELCKVRYLSNKTYFLPAVLSYRILLLQGKFLIL